jgi:hypothetical protein
MGVGEMEQKLEYGIFLWFQVQNRGSTGTTAPSHGVGIVEGAPTGML